MKQNINKAIETNKKVNTSFIFKLGALMALTSLSVDIYLPQIPQMEQELHGNIELTITGFLIGFALAQLIIGPISDRIGRKAPLFAGMILFIIGSLGCASSQDIQHIIFWRIIQAFGGCTGPMLSRAMIRDMMDKTQVAEMLSTLMLVMAIAPIVGPLIGGLLYWKHIFLLLAAIGFLILISLFWLPETLPVNKRLETSIKDSFVNYKKLLSNFKFMRYTLSVTFYYVGAYAFIAGSPFVYITYFGVNSKLYGFLFALNILGLMLVSVANRFLVRKFSLHSLLKTATTIAMITGIILSITTRYNLLGIIGVIIPVFFFFSMNGIIAATATAAALDDVPHIAGSASALLGSLQYGSGILSTFLLAFFSDNTPWTMGWIIGVSSTVSAFILVFNPFNLFAITYKFIKKTLS